MLPRARRPERTCIHRAPARDMPGVSRVRVIPGYIGIAGGRGIIAARGETKGLRVGSRLGEATMVVPIIFT